MRALIGMLNQPSLSQQVSNSAALNVDQPEPEAPVLPEPDSPVLLEGPDSPILPEVPEPVEPDPTVAGLEATVRRRTVVRLIEQAGGGRARLVGADRRPPVAYPVNTEPDACQVPWPICPAGCGPLSVTGLEGSCRACGRSEQWEAGRLFNAPCGRPAVLGRS